MKYGDEVDAYAIMDGNLIVTIDEDGDRLQEELGEWAMDLDLEIDELSVVPIKAVWAQSMRRRDVLVRADSKLGKEAIANRESK